MTKKAKDLEDRLEDALKDTADQPVAEDPIEQARRLHDSEPQADGSFYVFACAVDGDLWTRSRAIGSKREAASYAIDLAAKLSWSEIIIVKRVGRVMYETVAKLA